MADYCTYFDHRYLVRGVALYQSLAAHASPFRLHVLCLDELCFRLLQALELPHVRLLPLADLEAADPELAAVRSTRSLVEYYFTATPSLLLHLLRTDSKLETLTYLDADLHFFADPAPLFDELGDRPIGIIPHRFAPAVAHMAVDHGMFNVGWLTFRRGATTEACLAWWRERCLEWCFDRVEDGKYADQKYLDEWPERFPGVAVLRHPGANLAPWNLSAHCLRFERGHVTVDGQPLLFFHFHRLREILPWLFAPRLTDFAARATPLVRQHIYVPYLRTLRTIHRSLRPLEQEVRVMGSAREQPQPPPASDGLPAALESVRNAARRAGEIGRRLATREYFIFVNDRVL